MTVLWVTAFPHATATTQGGGIFTSLTVGVPTFGTASARASGSWMEIATNASTIRAGNAITVQNEVTVSFYFYIVTSLPAALTKIISINGTDGSEFAIYYSQSSNTFRATCGGGSQDLSGLTPAANTWYRCDMKVVANTNPHTLDWQIAVDGSAPVVGTQATNGVVGTTVNGWRFGVTSNSTMTCRYTDFIITNTAADYPIGAHDTVLIYPDADGSHSAGTNVIEDNAGTDIGTTTAYDKINTVSTPNTAPSATTYLRQAANGTGNYAEVSLSDIPSGKNPIGLMGTIAYTSETTSTNSAATYAWDGSSGYTIWGSSATPSDYSEGSTASLFFKSAIIGITLTKSNVDALKARFGNSADANPDPYLIDLWFECAYVVGTSTGTLSKTLDNLTRSISATVLVSGAVSKTLSGLTKSLSGTVLDNATLNKTLGSLTLVSSGTVATPQSNGTLNKTLDNLTKTINGTVLVSGIENKTLANLSKTIVGNVLNNASVSKTLANISKTISGQVIVSGSLNKLLSDLSRVISGVTLVSGNLNKTLNSLISNSNGTVSNSASLNKTLNNAILTSNTTVLISVNLSKSLGNLTLLSETDVLINASTNKTLEQATLDSNASAVISGNLSKTLGNILKTLNGTILVSGSVNKTLDNIILSASGTAGFQPITGTLNKTLANISLTSDVDILILANLNKTLNTNGLTSTATVLISGITTKTLDDVELISSGGSASFGNLNKTLADLSLDSSALVYLTGNLSKTLNSLVLLADADILVLGISTNTLENITVDSSGAITYTSFEQEGYRFRNNDGNEISATWLITQDTNANIQIGIPFRLRFIINAGGSGNKAINYQIEYRKRLTTDPVWGEWKKIEA